VQWPFADLLTSSHANNWFLGAHYHPASEPPTASNVRGIFVHFERSTREFWAGMAVALLSATISTSIGLVSGNWMRRVQR
jgi:ABC-type spermidine/putrescine transport system permease subunit II